MTAPELEAYLHEHIPLTSAMQLRVARCEAEGVELSAPLAPNSNHRGTVFGGSLASLATLAGWAVVHVGLHRAGQHARVVIQSSQIEYLRPAQGTFYATCLSPDPAVWEPFLRTMRRRGRARLALSVDLRSEGNVCLDFTGVYVAMK